MKPSVVGRIRLRSMGIEPSYATGDGGVEPASTASARVERVVADHAAMQAQEIGSGLLSLGLRAGVTRAQVEAAVAERRVVRTWPMRGTIHWVPAADARWMCALMATRLHELASVKARRVQLGIDDAAVHAARAHVERELATGEPVARGDLLASWEVAGIDTAGGRGYHLLTILAMDGVLAMGPQVGKQAGFVLLDAWLEGAPSPERTPGREEAMADLARRVVASHAPVTEADLAGWAGMTRAWVREAVALTDGAVTTWSHEGTDYLVPATFEGPESLPARSSAVHLLPGFDEFVLGYKDRSAVLSTEDAARVVPGNNGVFRGTVVAAGRVVGTWARTASTRKVTVTVTPMPAPTLRGGALTAGQRRGLERAVAAYGRFLGVPATLKVAGE